MMTMTISTSAHVEVVYSCALKGVEEAYAVVRGLYLLSKMMFHQRGANGNHMHLHGNHIPIRLAKM